jgi:hypothetical protein
MADQTTPEGDYYVEETGVENDTSNVNSSSKASSGRKSHTCCGKLMDTRKGVLVANFFNIFAILFSVIFQAIIFHERSFGGVFAGLLGIVLSLCGTYGAIKFDMRASGIATIGFCLCFLMDLIGLNLVGIIIDLALIYPHAYFTWEVYRGVMTKDTYKKEEYLMPGIPPFPEV